MNISMSKGLTQKLGIGYHNNMDLSRRLWKPLWTRKYCHKCQQQHALGFDCARIRCRFCHQIHQVSQFVQGICPRFTYTAQRLRKKHSLECYHCKGAAQMESETLITAEASVGTEPRQIGKFRQTKKCSKCFGTGLIHRFVYCCYFGCRRCWYRTAYEHPHWQKCKRYYERQKEDDLIKAELTKSSVPIDKFILSIEELTRKIEKVVSEKSRDIPELENSSLHLK